MNDWTYTCQLFLSQRCEIFNWRVPGFPKTTQTYPKFFEDFRRPPKMSEDVPNNSEILKKMIHGQVPVKSTVISVFSQSIELFII